MTDAAKTDYEKEAEVFFKAIGYQNNPVDRENVAAYLKARDQRIRAEARREAFEEARDAAMVAANRAKSQAVVNALAPLVDALHDTAAAQSTPVTQAKENSK